MILHTLLRSPLRPLAVLIRRLMDKFYKDNTEKGAGTESTSTMPEPKRAFLGKLAGQLGASIFFGLSSILIITVNKTVLTSYKFPSFQLVGLGQIFGIIIVLGTGKLLGLVDIPNPSLEQFKKVFPLPIFYIFNLIFGLGGTKKLSLPMFTVLRRFTLLLVSLGQIIILNKYESVAVNISLCLMIGGALVAALNDLAFDLTGYLFIMLNDIFTAGNSLYSKKKLDAEIGKYELMFYNAILVVIPAILLAWSTGELQKAYDYPGWMDIEFLVYFFLSCVMGFVLIYATFLCTQLTSALTLTVVGCIKNIAVTYLGMFIGGDFVFQPYNFIGINISVAASLVYSYFKYKEQQEQIQKSRTLQISV